MRNNPAQDFQLVDLKDHPEVMAQITDLEKQLNQMMDGKVALIAYVQNEKKE
ncbi:hypothetical protein ACFO25_06620 [Paenactinomyces guangxiensis]|uniref:Uncharacterized protein n=1 Tax=Paenactinomyces guangxiensis TaxID=1490290 RepID=A0A7W2A6E2_9BACL|nr:hypothetical protein [Paenactinomyces guangxiensis]MBA4493276.1 hypothetical protein [Paenactinomyces guangxiensis]MBH8589873.1 hypothetical protein [Paenactinomyces guangxiensis]